MSRDRSARLLRSALGLVGPVEPTEADWTSWVELAVENRAIPLLYEAVVRSASSLRTDQIALIDAMQLDVAGAMVRLEREALDVASLLSARGTDFALLKGLATAHLDYDDPSHRQFGDIDLLIDPEDLDDVLKQLGEAGWSQVYALPRGHKPFTHAVTLKGPGLAELDVHQRIAHRALGLMVPTRSLLDARVPFTIAGQPVWALSVIDRTIHAAIHSLTSRGAYRRLSSAADVLRLAQGTAPIAAEVLDRAENWRIRTLVEEAIRHPFAAAMHPLPPEWELAMRRPTRHRDRLVDWAYLSTLRRPLLEEVAYLRLMAGWGDRATYLRGYFSAGSEYEAQNRRDGLREQSRYLLSRLRRRA